MGNWRCCARAAAFTFVGITVLLSSAPVRAELKDGDYAVRYADTSLPKYVSTQ